MTNLLKKDKGFTLIEIVLVLAIAGLLLVIVFLAVSGAQRNRRDTQRKNDLSRIAAQVESYASNNNGCYPDSAAFAGCGGASTWAAFVGTTYITAGNFNDPLSGTAYAWTTPAQVPSGTQPAGLQYQDGSGTTCDGANNTSGRVYSIRMQLESGVACRDNK